MNTEALVDLIGRDWASDVVGGAGTRVVKNRFVPTQKFSVADTVAARK